MTPADAPATGGTPVSRMGFLKATAGAAAAGAALASPSVSLGSPGRRKPDPLPDALWDLDIARVAALIKRRRVSAVDLALQTLERIAAVESRVLSFAYLYPEDDILAQARRADSLLKRGTYLGPMHGITVGLKDIILTKGYPTEANSLVYKGFVPDEDAHHVHLLKKGGAVILGKSTTIELASGSPPPTNNPWDLARTPGGSSAGSGSGIAAGQFLLGMGSDTRGSIRGPSANCGGTGFRTTYGIASKHGVFPLSYSIDNVGPLVRTALDAALVVDLIGGQDPKDPTTRPVRRYALAKPLLEMSGSRPLRGIRIGVPSAGDYFRGVPSDDQLAAFDAAVKVFRSLGATVKEVTTSTLPAPLTTLNSISTPIVNVEVGAFQYQNWLTRAEDFTPNYRRQVNNGNLLPANAYVDAQRARALWNEQFLAMFETIDVFAHPNDDIAGLKTPTTPSPPQPRPSSGSKSSPWSLTGSPSISIPTGLSGAEGMPLSMLVNAAPGDDDLALLVCHAFQSATDFHLQRPPL
ncbi:MAG: amidase [Thermoleophilia bacterium]